MDEPFPRLERVEAFCALPLGSRAWLRLLGPCLEPLVRSGEWLCVRRCAASELAQGDLALLETPRGYVAHLLVHTTPPKSETLLGRADEGPLVLWGKVEAVEKSWGTLPLPSVLRHPLRMLQRGLSAAGRSRALRQVYRGLRDGPAGRYVARVETSRLGPPRVGALGLQDVAAFFILAARAEPHRLGPLRRGLVRELLPEARIQAVWDARGRLRLAGYLEPTAAGAGRLRGPFGDARFRGSAWETALVRALIQRARALGWLQLEATVLPGDVRARRVLTRAGFVPAHVQEASQTPWVWTLELSSEP